MTTSPAYVFDIGGVLCRFAPRKRLEALAIATGIDVDEIHARVWESGLDARADRGELTLSETTTLVIAALDGPLSGMELRAAWANAFIPDADVLALVRSLVGPRYAFTNNGPMLTACLRNELTVVADSVDRVICSWELGSCKPAAEAFELLLHEIDRPPDQVVFVDDSERNCDAAGSIGIHTIHFRSTADLELLQSNATRDFPFRGDS